MPNFAPLLRRPGEIMARATGIPRKQDTSILSESTRIPRVESRCDFALTTPAFLLSDIDIDRNWTVDNFDLFRSCLGTGPFLGEWQGLLWDTAGLRELS